MCLWAWNGVCVYGHGMMFDVFMGMEWFNKSVYGHGMVFDVFMGMKWVYKYFVYGHGMVFGRCVYGY